ncbi:uncharacterized protein [Cicer arietinum]|uniref:Lysosomal Pro-X carboxypeptidase isoform X2 n=1 Tax=Cicer arietinum TaxID=3827 RepID=A0A3Q7XYR7_CICAR|nr:lysosomal Pro-X carboxypeptidase isoform X2 [Cicer arietinum]
MKPHYHILFTYLHLIFFIQSINLTPTHSLKIPRLTPLYKWKTTLHNLEKLVSIEKENVETFYYKQVLDHFNYRPESYHKFEQRYFMNFKYWGGANSSAPIFAYLGAEDSIDTYPTGIGFMTDNAATFKALLVYIEHRYYGKSVPFGSRKKAFRNASTLGYFNSAQAIADYAAVLIHIKKTLHAHNSPIIVLGGSYGGMLASWFRLKYPHLTIGALASSAPILYFDNITPHNAYMDLVSREFKEVSETCYETILKSWSEIERISSQSDGLSILSERFNTCRPLKQYSDLSEYLESMYTAAVQYNGPTSSRVSEICRGIDGASFGNDILSKIYSGLVAYEGNGTCKINYAPSNISDEVYEGWSWQRCSEMVMPIGTGNDTMFQPDPFNLKRYVEECKKQYGVSPRPHWVTTYYGGHGIEQSFR